MFKKIILGIVILFFLVVIGLFIFINTFDVNKFLPQIASQASQAINRDVKIQKAKLHFSLIEGVSASVEGVAVADDPQFSNSPFLTVGQVRCGVRLTPLIAKQRVEVSYIRIQAPEVKIIKGKNGLFNFESMMKTQEQPKSAAPSESKGGAPSTGPAPEFPVLLVSSFKVDKAKVSYADQTSTPPLDFAVKDIDIEVANFSLTEPFKIKADASLFSPAPNVHVDGMARMDPKLQQIRLDDVHLDADLSTIDIAKLNKTVAALEPLGIQSINGRISAVTSQLLAGAGGLLVLSLEGQLSDGQVKIKPLAVPIDKITMKFDASESKIDVKEFFMALATGEIRAKGTVKNYMTAQQFEFDGQIARLPLEDVIDQKAYPVKIKGALSGDIKVAGQGFTPEAMNKITGSAVFNVAGGEVVGMNILKTVLDSLSMIPGLNDIAQKLPPELRQNLSGSNTKLDKVDLRTRVENALVLIDNADVQAQGFRLSANGQAGFDQRVAVTADMIMLKELAGQIIASNKRMAAVADENGEIHIPVKISGQVPSISFVPDLNQISKRVLVNEGSRQLEKVIQKNPEVKKFLDIFSGGGEAQTEGQPQDQSQDSNSSSTEPQEQAPQKKLLENIFKSF